MFHLVITLDYELPAGGRGDIREHMIEPTTKLMEACEQHGAKLTIMLEVGELHAFRSPVNKSFADALGYDPVREIREQLTDAVRRGHDVQLHLHPQWIGAEWKDGEWVLDYARYQLTDHSPQEMVRTLRQARSELEELLRPADSSYRCIGFRAGHWNTSPSDKYLNILKESGFLSDTSVFKGGLATGPAARFDYRSAHSNVKAWYACPTDVNRALEGGQGEILECPIASVPSTLAGMLSQKRIRSALKYRKEDREVAASVADSAGPRGDKSPESAVLRRARKLVQKRSKKLDFCKLSASEMARIVEQLQAGAHHGPGTDEPIPIVMIGHSKDAYAGDLASFLDQAVRQWPDTLGFSTYRDFIERYGRFRSGKGPGVPRSALE